MKPGYKNWIPKGMLFSLIAGTVPSLALLLVFGVFGIAFVVCAKYTEWCVYAYRSFSYDGERKLSKQIIDGTAEHIALPEGGVGLFLSYLPEDVRGFIDHRAGGFKCTGLWKVYGDEEKTCSLFAKYKKCTEIYCTLWQTTYPKRICSSIQDGWLESICVGQPWS